MNDNKLVNVVCDNLVKCKTYECIHKVPHAPYDDAEGSCCDIGWCGELDPHRPIKVKCIPIKDI